MKSEPQMNSWVGWFPLEITGPGYRRDITLVRALEIRLWADSGSWGQLSRILSFQQKEL